MPLGRMQSSHPDLFQQLQQRTAALRHIEPYSPRVAAALATHFGPGFQLSSAMAARSQQHKVAPVTWSRASTSRGGGDGASSTGSESAGAIAPVSAAAGSQGEEWLCVASGPVEAASHCETRCDHADQHIDHAAVPTLRCVHSALSRTNQPSRECIAALHPALAPLRPSTVTKRCVVWSLPAA
jgi:hypothetical protein